MMKTLKNARRVGTYLMKLQSRQWLNMIIPLIPLIPGVYPAVANSII